MGSKNTQPPLVGVPETNQAGFSTTVTDTTLSEALIVLRKRKLVLIIAVLLGLAYGIFKAESQPKLYESYGRIQVRSGSSNEYRVSTVQPYGGDASSKLLSEIEILKSDSLMLTVCREMDLANNADFLEQKGPVEHASLDDGETRQDTVHRLQSSLHVTVVPKTDIIRISYSSLNAKLSADIVNKVISDYVQRSYQTRFESSQRASVWLSGTLEGLKQEVESSQEQMMDMQRRLGILGFDPTHNQISASLDDLARAAGTAKLQRIIAEARYRVVSGMDPNTIEGTIELTPGTAPGELNLLRGQLAGARASYATLESSLGPNHPQAKAIKAQIDEYVKEIDEEQNRMITQAKQNYVVAKANEDQTTAALEAQKTDAYKLRDQLVEYTLRQREYEANRTLYDSLQQRLRTASVQSGLESLEVDVVDQALPPAEPLLRPQSTVILTALIFSLLAGIVAAFLMESLDTGLRSIAEIESIT
jgi:polysaccharide biosynthesis transport protein